MPNWLYLAHGPYFGQFCYVCLVEILSNMTENTGGKNSIHGQIKGVIFRDKSSVQLL